MLPPAPTTQGAPNLSGSALNLQPQGKPFQQSAPAVAQPPAANKLTPTLTEQQIRENIDALQKGGLPNEQVQSYVNNYEKTATGYSLKTPPQSLGDKVTGGIKGVSDFVANGAADTIGSNLGAMMSSASALKDVPASLVADILGPHAPAFFKAAQQRLTAAAQTTDMQKLPSFEQDIGAGAQVGSLVAGLAGAPEAGSIASKALGTSKAATGIVRGALQGARAGGITGSAFGAAQGAGSALSQNKGAGGVVGNTLGGAALGGLTGGTLGAIAGGTLGGLQGRALRQQQLLNDLNTNPDYVAKYDLSPEGTPIKNPQAAEAVRQGIPEKYVAVIKNAGPEDKTAFQKMIALADNATKDARAIDRPSDIVGQTIVDRTNHLVGQVKAAGTAVDKAAAGLRGISVDPTPAVDTFINNLQDIGVTFDKGVPNFEGSDIQGIKPAETLISRVVNRAQNVTDDASQIHQLKKFIDEQVTFSNQGEGLSGQTERIVKSFRHNLDGLLDGQNPTYDAANQAYAKAIGLLNDTKTVLGKNFDPASGAVRAGAVARRILGNSANRGDILEYLKNLEDFYTATGGKSKADVISQTVFADVLDEIYGTQATTGLSGQVQRGVEQAVGVGKSLMSGHPIEAAIKTGAAGINALRNVTPEAKIAALKALIGGVR